MIATRRVAVIGAMLALTGICVATSCGPTRGRRPVIDVYDLGYRGIVRAEQAPLVHRVHPPGPSVRGFVLEFVPDAAGDAVGVLDILFPGAEDMTNATLEGETRCRFGLAATASTSLQLRLRATLGTAAYTLSPSTAAHPSDSLVCERM